MRQPTDKELIDHARKGFSEGHAAKQLAFELAERLETAHLEIDSLNRLLESWMNDFYALKNKYEPLVGIIE